MIRYRTFLALALAVAQPVLAAPALAQARGGVPAGPTAALPNYLKNYMIQQEARARKERMQVDTTCELKMLQYACSLYNRDYHTIFDPTKLSRAADPHYGYNPLWGVEFWGVPFLAKDLGLTSRFIQRMSLQQINNEIDMPAFREGRELLFLRAVKLLDPPKTNRPYDGWLGSSEVVIKEIKKPGFLGGVKPWHAMITKGVIQVLGRRGTIYLVRDVADGKEFEVPGNHLQGLTTHYEYNTEAVLLGPPEKPLITAPAKDGTNPPVEGDGTVPPGDGGKGSGKQP